MNRLTIYLAGPITGVSSSESTSWRDEFRSAYGDRFNIISPLDRDVNYKDYSGRALYSRIANGERMDILNSDAILAYVYMPSMGTAMGMMYGYLSGRTVVVVNDRPEMQLSEMVKFHAHAILPDFKEAVDFILKRHERSTVKAIMKRDGRMVPWDPSKIENAIEMAINNSYGDERYSRDITPPRADILARVAVMRIEDALEKKDTGYNDLHIEYIQDVIEKVLIDNSHREEVFTLAKSYILYRRKRQEVREKTVDDGETLNFIKSKLHDIKNPTGNIKRLCDSIKDDLESGDVESAGRVLDLISANQAQIVKSIFSMKSDAENKFRKDRHDVSKVVHDIIRFYDDDRNIAFQCSMPDGCCVEAPAEKLKTIFINLIDNSIKHGLVEGKGTIYITAEKSPDNKLFIEYWNDGRAITRQEANSIFSGVPKPGDDGTGFHHGMYQTKNYILQLGGTIECELENKSPDAGGRQAGMTAGTPVFKIALPLSKDAREIKKTILVADDVDVERSTLRTILEKAGYAVLEAASIDSSLEIARSGNISGAIIDVDFHDAENRNGLYLLKEIMKTGDSLRVIVVSGSESGAHSNWQADAKAYGAIGAFDKQDYTAEQILNCLG